MLNVVFSFNFYEVYLVMENSKDLELSIGDVTYRMEYWYFKILVQWYTSTGNTGGCVGYRCLLKKV